MIEVERSEMDIKKEVEVSVLGGNRARPWVYPVPSQ
jgi:hypothetical protein